MDLHLEKLWLNSAGALQHPHHLTLKEAERAEIMANTSLLTRGNALSVLSVFPMVPTFQKPHHTWHFFLSKERSKAK